MRWVIVDDGTIPIFKDIAFNLQNHFKLLGMTVPIQKNVKGNNTVFFILNPHHGFLNKISNLKIKNKSNRYIGWDLTNYETLKAYQKYWVLGSKYNTSKLFDLILYDDISKKETLQNISFFNKVAYLPVTLDFMSDKFYNLDRSSFVRTDNILFLGSLKDEKRKIDLKFLKWILKNRIDTVAGTYGISKMKILQKYRYMLDTNRKVLGKDLVLLPTIRHAVALNSGILPISISKYSSDHSLYIYKDISEFCGYIEDLDKDPFLKECYYDKLINNWKKIGSFTKNLKVITQSL